ncbi:MAG: AMP-binding protein [Planctomycetes bacterium]|nr:AMP-binding protein [Planctomycetota bacterium]
MHPILTPFSEAVDRAPTRLAAADQSLALDYGTFASLAAGLACRIREQTERPHVGIMTPTSVAGALSIFACWLAGRVPTPLNFLLSPAQLAHVIRDAELDLVLSVDLFAPALAAAGVRTLLLKGNTTLVPGACPAPAASDGDLGALIYTSGTSGDPKGVRLTFGNVSRNALACIEHVRLTRDSTLLSVLPQFHSFGFTAMTIVPLMLGASVHYLPRFSPAAVVSTIADTKATVFMAVASMYAAISKMKSADRDALASLKLAISGGEALPLNVAEEFERRFGVPICEGYGLTETSPVVSINQPWNRRVGSVGIAVPGVTVEAVDSAGAELPRGCEGELTVRGHCVMEGYHKNPQATAQTIRGGALFTGDVGRVDADGFIFITGRAKELLIIGGENVAPREIENALVLHPAVAEAAVIGVADPLRGETPLAFVILHEGASVGEAELRSFCRGRLAPFKIPREVRIVHDLPRGPTGKILKRALRSL